MPHTHHASASYSHETSATTATIWGFFTDVAGWKEWNAGVYSCVLEGLFIKGTWMTMVLPDQEVIKSQLVEVTEPTGFTDETTLGDITVRVRHEVSLLPAGNCSITYTIDVIGIGAQAVCDQVSSDFPDVLRALAERAERQVSQ